MNDNTIFYKNRHGVVVTSRFLRTKHRDQGLAQISSLRISREPFYLAIGVGVGLAAFGFGFSDLLYFHEELVIAFAAAVILFAGFAVCSLQMGSYAHEKTMLWGTYWTVKAVRDAIIEARRSVPEQASIDLAIVPNTD